jgi:hypothetical protein
MHSDNQCQSGIKITLINNLCAVNSLRSHTAAYLTRNSHILHNIKIILDSQTLIKIMNTKLFSELERQADKSFILQMHT